MALGLFSKKDKIDKYWDKFNKVLSHPKTTAKNAFMRLHKGVFLPGGLPLEFENEEQGAFAQRYGVQFCDLMTDALTQGKISINFADVLLRDYMNIEEMEHNPLEQPAFLHAYTNYIHVGIERCCTNGEADASIGEYFTSQNEMLNTFMLDDAGELAQDEVEAFILNTQKLAYYVKRMEEPYNETLFSYVEGLMDDREISGLSDRFLYEVVNQAIYHHSFYDNTLCLKALAEVSREERYGSSNQELKHNVVSLMKNAVENPQVRDIEKESRSYGWVPYEDPQMPDFEKAWVAYALKTYLGVECENLDVSQCHNVDSDKGRISAVCVRQENRTHPSIFFTKVSAAPLDTLPEDNQDEKQRLTTYFNDGVKPSVYELSNYVDELPMFYGESGAVLVERIKDEQHIKKLEKLTIH